MHNLRIGRDDVLKIEVSLRSTSYEPFLHADNTPSSGLALPHRHHGVLTLVVIGTDAAIAGRARRPVEAVLLLPVAAHAIIPLERTIVVTGTGIGTTTETGVTPAIVLAARILGTDPVLLGRLPATSGNLQSEHLHNKQTVIETAKTIVMTVVGVRMGPMATIAKVGYRIFPNLPRNACTNARHSP